MLYQALRQGALQGISTDHCPFNFKEQKELGLGDFTKIPNGLPAIEHRLTLLYDRSVRAGPHERSSTSCATARGGRRGSSGSTRKGAIAPGFDADIVVFDPEVKHTISAETHVMNVDYDPFEGWEVQRQAALRALARRDRLRGRQGRLRSRAAGASSSARSSSRRWPDAAEFGVTVLPDPPYQRLVELIVKAESARLRLAAGPTTRRSCGRSRTR